MIDESSEDGPSIDSLLRDAGRIEPVVAEPDRVGQRLARFRIEEELGRGGMGIVYAAADVELGRQVALKVLPRAAVADGERRRRFVREARTAASLSHPNIAAVFDVGEADGTVFLAMELVRGQTLRALIAANPQGIAASEAIRIARAVAHGLGNAHERGVVHRDLKPENVMMAIDGNPKIVDFGLAKLHASPGQADDRGQASLVDLSTQDGKILGTPSYMAPEQAKGSRVTPSADVFSLGVVLYEMLTGARPFGGATLVDVLVSIARDTPDAPSKKVTRVSRQLDRVVLRCLAKDPEARYRDGDALAAALDGRAIEARWPTLWALLALALTLAAGSVITLVGVHRADHGPTTTPSGVAQTRPSANPLPIASADVASPPSGPALTAAPPGPASPTRPASAPAPIEPRPPAFPRQAAASSASARAAPSTSVGSINPLARQK